MTRKVKKAVLLVAGKGKRLYPITRTRPKPMIPFAGKPLLQYIVEYLRDVGINEVLLIDGYRKEQIRNHFKDGGRFGIRVKYAEQQEFLGTAHATNIAREFIGQDCFMLLYGDILMDKGILEQSLALYERTDVNALLSLFRVDDPEKYGIIQLDDADHVKKIIEKPVDDRYGNLANAGIYIFDSNIFDGIERTPKSSRGEYELTDSMQVLVDEDYKILGMDIKDKYWSDVGHPWQLLDANKHILGQISAENKGKVDKRTDLIGSVFIDENAHVKSGSRIEGPVYIGKNTIIGPNAYIRPFSSIGNDCKIGNSSELKNSIVLDGTYIAHLSYAGDSIIGEEVNFGAGSIISNVRLDKREISMRIKGKVTPTRRKKMGAVIGDRVQLGVNCSIMVGKKIGQNSRIGANTVIVEDVAENMLVYSKQLLEHKSIDEKNPEE